MYKFWENCKFWKNDRVFAIVLNVAIGILLFFIFLQCGIFLNGYASTRGGDAQIPFDMRMLSQSGQEAGQTLDTDLLLPAAIAVSRGGEARAALNAAAVMRDLYGAVSSYLSEGLANEPQLKDKNFWASAIACPDVVYIQYHAPLPYQILYAFASASAGGEYTEMRDARVITVSELCLCFLEERMVAVARGADGVYSFPISQKGEIADYAGYVTEYPESFYACTLSFSEDASSLTVTERVSFREIQVSGGVSGRIMEDEANFTQWLRRLQFNPDKLNYHTETDGTVVYVESHGVLFCSLDSITYTGAEGGGIGVNEFCTETEEADIYTYLRAASAWISSVSAMNIRYTGGDGELLLTSVYAEGDAVVLRFGVYVDNLPLYYNGTPAAVSLSFTEDVLSAMEWRMVLAQKQLGGRTTLLASFSQSVLGSNDVRLIYRADSTRQNVLAEWISFSREEDV